MHRVLILGAGKIGALISGLLAESGAYEVHARRRERRRPPTPWCAPTASANLRAHALDASNSACAAERTSSAHPVDAVISSLPYYCNVAVARPRARQAGAHYFDLTEDVEVTRAVRAHRRRRQAARSCLSAASRRDSSASPPTSSSLTSMSCARVKLRVGALPQHPNNVLKYSLTWSTEGLINEYGNPCQAILDGRLRRRRTARGPRGDRDRRHALRGVQHLGRPGLARRNLRRARREHELQDHPLPRATASRCAC